MSSDGFFGCIERRVVKGKRRLESTGDRRNNEHASVRASCSPGSELAT
jgi:hypothetical protein